MGFVDVGVGTIVIRVIPPVAQSSVNALGSV